MPENLKDKAQELVDKGFYVSFSDLVRDSLRQLVEKSRYDSLYEEALEDERKGRAVVLRNKKEIEEYMKAIR